MSESTRDGIPAMEAKQLEAEVSKQKLNPYYHTCVDNAGAAAGICSGCDWVDAQAKQ